MNLLKKTVILYALLALLFTLLITLSACLPSSTIKKNVAVFAQQISNEDLWWKPMGVYLFQIDNMTDCLMLGICACDNQPSAVNRALLAEHPMPKSDDITTSYKLIDEITYQYAIGKNKEKMMYGAYARYWHGYTVLLRPLLCVFNYWQIRMVNYILLSLLAMFTVFLLYREVGAKFALTFAVTLLISNFMIVPMALQFSTCYYIAFGAICLFLMGSRFTETAKDRILVFFLIGAVCSFMDLLTTPILTLGLPVVALCLKYKDTKLQTAISYSVFWLLGYASLWVTKWIVTCGVTGMDVISDAMDAVKIRVGDNIFFGGEEMPMTRFFDIVIGKIEAMVSPYVLLLVLLAIVLAVILMIYKYRCLLQRESCIAFVALMPLLWFVVLKNHSIQHIFFTWRDWILTLWCVMLLFLKFQENNKELQRL